MVNEIYDDHEQGERVRQWLKENGGGLVMGLILAFGGIFGWRQYQAWDAGKRSEAAAIYENLATAAETDDLEAVESRFGELRDDHDGSAYAGLAGLLAAREQLDAGFLDRAAESLRYVAENGEPEELRQVARLRLARVMIARDQPDEALALLEKGEYVTALTSAREEVRGDALIALGRNEEARRAYDRALKEVPEGVAQNRFLEMKIDALGGPIDTGDEAAVDDAPPVEGEA